MDELPTAPVAAAGLVGGFAVAQATDTRALGGAVLGLVGAWCVRAWWRREGPGVAVGLGLAYLVAFAGSHVLARQIGAWPAVLSVAAATGAAAYLVADRR